MELDNNPGIILGETAEVVETSKFHTVVSSIGMIICFTEGVDAEGVPVWELPLVLESIPSRNSETGQMQRSQGFRPLVPLSKDTKFYPNANFQIMLGIVDKQLESAYRATVRDIKSQLSGIVLPSKSGIVGGDGSPIVG